MDEKQGCATLVLVFLLFLGIVLTVTGNQLGFIILGAAAVVFARAFYEGKKARETAQQSLGNETLLCSTTAELVGGNHPLLGSSRRTVVIGVSEASLAIAENRIPLTQVKAQVTTQSAVSAMGIFLFGLLALGAKDKVLVLEFDDPASKERYSAVFKDVANPEQIADTINRQRYMLLTGAQPQQEAQE